MRVGEFGYGSRPVRCLPSWGTGRSSGSSVHPNTHPGRPLCVAVFFLVRGSSRVEGEVLAVSRGFPLPRAVSELRSRGWAACSTISPPAVPYTVSPVSTVYTLESELSHIRLCVEETVKLLATSSIQNNIADVHRTSIKITRCVVGLSSNSLRDPEAGRNPQHPSVFFVPF